VEDEYDLGTGMIVISIVLEPGRPPQIELDGCNPCVALQIFKSAAELLDENILRPTIYSTGQLVAADDINLFVEYNEEEEE